MAKNQFLNWEKLLKMQFNEKKIDFTSFFAWTFINFLAHCGVEGTFVGT